MGSGSPTRLSYLDFARGLCVLLMIATHAFYGWVRPEDQTTAVFRGMRLIGGFPGAVFLFVSGLVLALGAESHRRRGAPTLTVVRHGAARGLEILGYAFLFRLWMYASGRLHSPWDLQRVDILNCIGASLLLTGLAVLPFVSWRARVATALALAAALALATPFAWDSGLARLVPLGLAGYVDGRLPSSFFPLFPWAGFTALGIVGGLLLSRARAAGGEHRVLSAFVVTGALLLPLSMTLDRVLPALYPRPDFWHTSPLYFLFKAGIVLLAVGLSPLLDRLPGGGALRQMGTTSLLIYWVHLEIVYGSYVVPWARERLTLGQAAIGVLLLTAAMLALSRVRTHGLRLRRPMDALAKA